MKKIIKVISINLIIFAFFLEIISLTLMKINIIPDGLPPNIILNAHEEYGYWHPKNSNFKIATKCWKSTVQFNDIGLKSEKNFKLNKTKKRIAILGDSMTENAQLDNDKDFSAKLQNLLPNYEVLNFSVSSLGLADQIRIFEKLVKKYDVDYVFLYITHNDFTDNHISKLRPNRITYKIENDNVIEINKDKKKYFERYNSNWNRFKREKLIYIKKYSSSFKLYYYVKKQMKTIRYKKDQRKINDDKNYIEDKKKIFEFIVNNADEKIFSIIPTLIFINSYNFDFYNEELGISHMKKILKGFNLFDPREEFTQYLKNNDLFKEPYLGYNCDAHYSDLGAKLLAEYSFKKFNTFLKNN